VYVGGDRLLLGPEKIFDHACPTVEIDDHGIKLALDVQSVHDIQVIENALGDRIIGGLTIIVKKSRCRPVWPCSHEESIALEALRETITEDEYRRYLRNGFLSVRGASGLVYQICRSTHHMIKVWRGNKMVEEICVSIKNVSVPPTDAVIAFKTIVEADEDDIRNLGNVYKFGNEAGVAAAA